MTATTDVAHGPRDRLLAATARLLDVHGVGVGLDTILSEAAVARRSLYQHFGGKDELVAQALARASQESLERYRTALASGGQDPRARLLAVFDTVEAMTAEPGYRGCRFLRADLALVGIEHPAHDVVRAHKAAVRELLRAEVLQLGHPHVDDAVVQLQLLIDGALTVAASRPSDCPAHAARTLARAVLDRAAPEPS